MGGLFVGMGKGKKKEEEGKKEIGKKEVSADNNYVKKHDRMHRTLPNTSSLFPIPSRVYIINS